MACTRCVSVRSCVGRAPENAPASISSRGCMDCFQGLTPGLFGTTHGGLQFMAYEAIKRRLHAVAGRKEGDLVSFALPACEKACVNGPFAHPLFVVFSVSRSPSTSLAPSSQR